MLHRYGSVAERLALRILALDAGDRLESVGDMAREFGTGRGTVQSALQMLARDGGLELERRGRLGSFVKRMDRAKLLAAAGISPVIGIMPVPYSLRFQGLALGLTRAFARSGLPLLLAHVRGGKHRLHFLRSGRGEFAIISRLAWEEEAAAGDLHLVHAFGPGSHVGDHILVMADPTATGITDGMRVGVDPGSHDHLRLTLAECEGRSVVLVEISYAQAIPRLLAGDVDAALWDSGVALPPVAGLITLPRRRSLAGSGPDTEALLVTREGAHDLGALLERRVERGLVISTQNEVLVGGPLPAF